MMIPRFIGQTTPLAGERSEADARTPPRQPAKKNTGKFSPHATPLSKGIVPMLDQISNPEKMMIPRFYRADSASGGRA
jgi:hypothetical protein